ncbi:MAG TPA: DUF2723 domain-containing protein [Verrucomicrobiae bacterium]|jgi:tetratricopeptide (TPR) repeat protein|nr:DUF2723 domain-containing protein [Verrucomicrobiae bacterium]
MSADNLKDKMEKNKSVDKSAPAKPTPPSALSGKVPSLFRKIDWLALAIAFAVIWVIYFSTLAPEVTLEDSGELVTGSFYAGIPHPPGYPFWAIYSWLWTVLLPVGNIAWRVEVGEATAEAIACGMVALIVSRGSSMLIEGIEELKDLVGSKWESIICLVCGATAGLLLGLGGTMWNESVAINRISLFGVPWVMAVLLCLMRWIYAPRQLRYLFFAMFFFGLCATIHQTLLVVALGIEAAVACAQPRLARTFFLGNSIIFIGGLIAHLTHITTALDTAATLLLIFFSVGLASIAAYIAFAIITKETFDEFCLDGALAGFLLFAVLAVSSGPIFGFLSLASFIAFVYMAWKTRKIGLEWLTAFICLGLWMGGAAFYLYEPISGMTNPPMEWGYPRTVDGFWHALSRGQYEKANPTDIIHEPGKFVVQVGWLIGHIVEDSNWILFFMAIIPLLFFMRMRKRERSWMICLAVTYLCIGPLLVILMNPGDDKASTDLHKVFFGSSHGVVAIFFGYGMSLTAAVMATHYKRFRQWGLMGGGFAAVLVLYSLYDTTRIHYYGPTGSLGLGEMPHLIAQAFGANQGGLPILASLVLLVLPFIFLGAVFAYRERAPLAVTLGLFAIMPVYSGLIHWGPSEERNHWFGYWFGHDMFTPPFVGSDGKLTYDKTKLQAANGTSGHLIYPEMARNAILFGGTDPGRFCPTYMIFCESFTPHQDQPKQDQHFDRRDVYIITQNALADPTYLEYIRAQYNRSTQIDPPFFQELLRGSTEVQQNYTTNFLARMAYSMLDEPLTKWGRKVEDRRRAEGVYPPKEIYCPTAEDSSQCFSEYMLDAQQRLDHDMRFPKEPKQIKPGEDVHLNPGDNKVQVSGQVAVMSINGLLTKVIFDHNPDNEFYVEESFPLDWMYPYLTPFGVIMKINRTPLETVPTNNISQDHEFWSRYSDRLIGNWITYDTSVKDIAAFVDRVYIQHDFTGFKGDRKFIRDDEAQKAFSKLRSAIGGIYDWRFRHAHDGPDQMRMLKEADFAYRQSFAYCPYSPEAVFRYVNLLLTTGRIDDALTIAQICFKLDPNNANVEGLVRQLGELKSQHSTPAQPQANLQQLEKEVADNPTNFQAAFSLAADYIQAHQEQRALQILDQVLDNPKVDQNAVMFLAGAYVQMRNYPKLEAALSKLTQLEPHSPEAWCDLAAMRSVLGKTNQALQDLRRTLEENSARLSQDPKASNLLLNIRNDQRFAPLHPLPEYQQLVGGKT